MHLYYFFHNKYLKKVYIEENDLMHMMVHDGLPLGFYA